jgi:hypothetical protein
MRYVLAITLLLCSSLSQGQVRPDEAALQAYLTDLCDWVMTLDVGSGELKNTKDTPWSIFINGNLARMLMAGYQITGKQAYLDEALRWADTFVQQQQIVITSRGEEGGYWADRGPTGNIYFGDAGTAATALALACRFSTPARQQIYQRAMDRYVRFVYQGSLNDPQGKGRGAARTWFVESPAAKGAIGTGYYKGHLSPHPYTVSTATTAAAFFSQYFALTRKPEIARDAYAAASWLLSLQRPEGGIPYIIDGTSEIFWPLAVMTYCGEGFVGVHTLVDDQVARQGVARGVKPSIEWLVKTQNADGTWGQTRSDDQQRSPGVLSLLNWYYTKVDRDPRVRAAVDKYVAFLLDPANSRTHGVKELVRTTGFVGLAIAEVLRPGITFRAGLAPAASPVNVTTGGGYFPVMVGLGGDGALAVVRGGGAHIGRAGRLDIVRTKDGGRTWSAPRTAIDGPEDDRNPAFGVLKDGTVLLAYAVLSGYEPNGKSFSSKDAHRAFDGVYCMSSRDNGVRWSKPWRDDAIHQFYAGQGIVSPYGKIIQLRDGTIIMPVYFIFNDQRKHESYIFRSRNGGRSWGEPSLLGRHFNETSVVELPDGRLLAAMRSEIGGHVSTVHSSDGGRTWTEPRMVTRNREQPADLIVTRSGEVVLTFGQRNRPLGVQALVSPDGGVTWDQSRRVILAGDAPNGDCGYPSSVELADGRILTMFYQVDDANDAPQSARARAIAWEIPPGRTLPQKKGD